MNWLLIIGYGVGMLTVGVIMGMMLYADDDDDDWGTG